MGIHLLHQKNIYPVSGVVVVVKATSSIGALYCHSDGNHAWYMLLWQWHLTTLASGNIKDESTCKPEGVTHVAGERAPAESGD